MLPQHGLANLGIPVRNRSRETLEMGSGKSSVLVHSIRTAIAATVSLAVARLFGLPEAYWAAIATLVVMQSTLSATLLISIERIAATALGALAGALLASYLTGNLLAFAAAVFVWDFCALDFTWRKPHIVMRASRSPLSCLFRVQTLHGSLRFIASSKSRLESWSLWRSWPSGRSINLNPQNKTLNDLRVVLEHALRSRTNSRSRFVSAGPNYARIVGPRETNSGNSPGCKIPARISRLSTMRGPGRAKYALAFTT